MHNIVWNSLRASARGPEVIRSRSDLAPPGVRAVRVGCLRVDPVDPLAERVDVDVPLVTDVAEVDALPAVGCGAVQLSRPSLLAVLIAALSR